MTDQYADIAEKYQKSKQHPWRLCIEDFTLFDLIGNVTGKAILDLACGAGFYTRRLKQRGAARVQGVDLSPPMVELACAEEARQPLGIEYLVRDCSQLEHLADFDLVVAAYLLNYARTRDELLAMCRSVARNLKRGGRFVTVNTSMDPEVESYTSSRKYGFTRSVTGELREGTPITITIFEDNGSFSFDNYFLSNATYEWALATAGLREVHWHAPRVSPQGEAQFGKEYWADFLAHPAVVFLECTK